MRSASLETFAAAMKRRLGVHRRFLKNSSGSTAIEFGMILVPFIGLLGAIFETGTIYFRAAQLQVTTEVASRAMLTHSLSGTITNQNFINSNVCTWQSQSGVVKPGTLSSMFDCTKVMIQVTDMNGAWSTVDATGADIIASYTPGGVLTIPAAGDVAVVRVVYPMSSVFNILGASFSPVRSGYVLKDGKYVYMLVGMYAFRVEPGG